MTKMVSLADKLGKVLGNDVSKYTKAMEKRLEGEVETRRDVKMIEMSEDEMLYTLDSNRGVVYVGTQDHFDWSDRQGLYPKKISEDRALHLVNNDKWVIHHDEPLTDDMINDVKRFNNDKAVADAMNHFVGLDWDDDSDGKIRRRNKDKEDTVARKKQRQRKVVYSSDDSIPVYGYDEDWDGKE
jgi:hypothetical protein